MLFQTEIDPVLGKGRRWPAVGSWMVCDARLWNRPPTAISPNLVLNPIKQDPSLSWAILINFGERDPKPLAADWGSFIAGDKSVLPGTDNPCWFRVYRRKPAVFIIACGAGSSGGYQSWAEVEAAGQGSRWGSQEVWETIRMGEPRLWYEVEWNAGVNTASTGYIYSGNDSIVPTNISKTFGNGTDHPNKRNQMGTFLYLQRLEREPDIW
jgi:hypothetical protein